MALSKQVLKTQLYTAFEDAMKQFIAVAKSGGIVDSQSKAITAASNVFSTKASNAIDAYIKSATITVPPGQAVVTTGGAGTTTTPSLPATIS